MRVREYQLSAYSPIFIPNARERLGRPSTLSFPVGFYRVSSASFSDLAKRLQTPSVFGPGFVPTKHVEIAVIGADLEEQVAGDVPLVDDFFNKVVRPLR